MIINTNDWSRGKQLILFPENINVSWGETCYGGRRSTFAGNSASLPSDAQDFAMLLAQRFWWETVSLLGVKVTNESELFGRICQLYNNL